MGHKAKKKKILRKQLELLAEASKRENSPSSLSMLTKAMVKITKRI